jgi:hypothetical protein
MKIQVCFLLLLFLLLLCGFKESEVVEPLIIWSVNALLSQFWMEWTNNSESIDLCPLFLNSTSARFLRESIHRFLLWNSSLIRFFFNFSKMALFSLDDPDQFLYHEWTLGERQILLGVRSPFCHPCLQRGGAWSQQTHSESWFVPALMWRWIILTVGLEVDETSSEQSLSLSEYWTPMRRMFYLIDSLSRSSLELGA